MFQRIARRAMPVTIAAWLLNASMALAATAYNDTISGAEYYATSTLGAFAGTANGDLPGTFDTQVEHTPLSSTATITGGSFTLYTAISGEPAFVTGTFASGTVAQVDKNTKACRDQHYAVNGTLQNVGVNGSGSGTGTFSATLTHYRLRIGQSCITYFATITGSVSLAF